MFKVLVLILTMVAGAFAAQVQFSSTLFSSNLDSEGNELTDDWVFALGSFDDGFLPTPENREMWADHWTTAKVSAYNPNENFFSGEFEFSNNAAPFTTTTRGYIWGFNCTGEWLLVSNPDWKWPGTNDPLALPKSWTINTATEVILGEVDTNGVHIRTADGGSGFQVPGFPYPDWQASYFNDDDLADSVISGPDADPDGDGHPNLVEYAQGTNPRKASEINRGKVLSIENNGVIYPALEFKVSNKAVGVTFFVGSSTDLQDWTGASNITLRVSGGDPGKQIFRSIRPVSETPARFFRIEANQSP